MRCTQNTEGGEEKDRTGRTGRKGVVDDGRAADGMADMFECFLAHGRLSLRPSVCVVCVFGAYRVVCQVDGVAVRCNAFNACSSARAGEE